MLYSTNAFDSDRNDVAVAEEPINVLTNELVAILCGQKLSENEHEKVVPNKAHAAANLHFIWRMRVLVSYESRAFVS